MPTKTRDDDPLAPHSLSASELKGLLAAERMGLPLLAYRDGAGELRIIEVAVSDRPLSIGRRQEMDVALPWDAEVSGFHAELQCTGGEVTITDDGLSKNGTFVNQQRVVGRLRLRNRDRVRIGRTVLAYRSVSPVQTTAAASEAPELLRVTETQRGILVALCRPMGHDGAVPVTATNQQIGEEVHLSIDAVKMHLRKLFAAAGLSDLPQNQKRARLAEYALRLGIVTPRDIG